MDALNLIDRIAPGRVSFYPQWASNDLVIASSNLLPMIDTTGEMQGRCAVVEHSGSLFGLQAGIVTVGGLLGGSVNGLAGILVGTQAELLNRSVATPLVVQDVLFEWANKQAELLREAKQLTWILSAKLLALGADSGELLVVSHGAEDWTENRLTVELNKLSEIWLLEDRECQYESDTDEVLKSDYEKNLVLDSRVFVIKSGISSNEFIHSTQWPSTFPKKYLAQPNEVFEKVVNSLWPDADLIESKEQVVGHVLGVPILRDVKIIRKTVRISELD
jgi:hypothetical protein